MGRKPLRRGLDVHMNGRRVGLYSKAPDGAVSFTYDPQWTQEVGLQISRALPLRDGAQRGPQVIAVFENLLPDSPDLRRLIAERTGAAGTDPHALLAAIGRDCVGALQFLPEGTAPGDAFALHAVPQTEAEIAAALSGLGRAPLGLGRDEAFRISLAGAQEKTAYLRQGGAWCRPEGLTPTSHIFKRPMGALQQGIDMSDSVENEFLCMRLAGALGFDVPQVEMARFGAERALVVARFDRLWQGDWNAGQGRYLRLPQEDFLQALGLPSTLKYQSDGGPSAGDCYRLLAGAQDPRGDQKLFLKAQLFFWMIGATDGHAKNFSLFHEPRGYRLTPLYDILSAAPAHAAGALRNAQYQMAMSAGRSRKYRMDQLHPRHFVQSAVDAGCPEFFAREALAELARRAAPALREITPLAASLPRHVAGPILARARDCARLLVSAAQNDMPLA
ncbi:HipA domain-containing protein [Salipiger sp. PrR002]|uniref:HipA domain-containing protein n=1 Tax=Salipiger sp. PrR002 TaxID=2706489 RepID=UPI0013B790BB|nr:HipA domain-containing protein [Salipiger sp. PrR002]NDW02457.1 type II toxin-antitoxin system HipA family toxin [Salipiger sp. PrR002]NDW59576.1 type II toxin-antitoxin system HipA family toxin [Salipiger sp. PrR004]